MPCRHPGRRRFQPQRWPAQPCTRLVKIPHGRDRIDRDRAVPHLPGTQPYKLEATELRSYSTDSAWARKNAPFRSRCQVTAYAQAFLASIYSIVDEHFEPYLALHERTTSLCFHNTAPCRQLRSGLQVCLSECIASAPLRNVALLYPPHAIDLCDPDSIALSLRLDPDSTVPLTSTPT